MAVVHWLEGRVNNRPKPGEQRPEKAALTDADCVSQEILLVVLAELYPWVGVHVEEDTPSVARFADSRSAYSVVRERSGSRAAESCWCLRDLRNPFRSGCAARVCA